MTSFNHYALGAVADWMHRTIGGIAPAEPGYRAVRIAPAARRWSHLGQGVAAHPARRGGSVLEAQRRRRWTSR